MLSSAKNLRIHQLLLELSNKCRNSYSCSCIGNIKSCRTTCTSRGRSCNYFKTTNRYNYLFCCNVLFCCNRLSLLRGNMKLITEMYDDFEILTEGKGKDMKIKGVFMHETKNRNGRVYPLDVLQKEVARYNKELVESKRAHSTRSSRRTNCQSG